MTKIRTKGTGTPEWRNGHWWARISLPDGTRPRYRLCADVCECATMSEARRLDRCEAISERKRTEVTARIAADEKDRREKRLTVKQFGEQWTSGKLLERYGEVKGLRLKASAKDDDSRLKRHVYPLIGDMRVADVTEQDIERVMAAARRRKRGKGQLRQATKYQVYQVMRRLFDLAVRPGRLRETSPVSTYLRPQRTDSQKLFGFLYPSELLAVLKCEDVPIGRRMLYALAIYTGLRKGSLYALTWAGVDFEHGTLTSLHSKTGLPQLFEVERLSDLLARWYEHQGRPAKGAKVIVGVNVRAEREATVLREDLAAAGVTRHKADGQAENVQPLRFHDLRATFVTWAMREGRGDGWIADRTGHLTPEMRARYARAARTLADLRYEPFPSLDRAVPELWNLPDNVRSITTARRT